MLRLTVGRRSGYGWWVIGFATWAVALVVTFHAALSWDFKAGLDSAGRPKQLEANHRPLLVVVLHSQCPCSLASVENLIELPAPVRAQLTIHLVFTGPDTENSPLSSRADALTNVEREYLSGTEVLSRYGARTSGQAYLYNGSGEIVFSGGLTDSRGTAGQSAGMLAILETVAGRKCTSHSPVYGCALQTPGSPV